MSKNRVEILKGTQMFQNANDSVLKTVCENLKEVPLKNNETLFYKGDKGHAMYIIESGSVSVHDGEHVFDVLKKGNVFGEYSLIDTETRSATITGKEDSLLLSLNKDSFYKMILNDQEVLNGILKVMVARLRNLDVVQEELSTMNNMIGRQNDEIEEKNEELTSLNEEKNHLISIVAHDIRNPLSSASTFANLLKSDADTLDEDQNEYVTHLIRSLNRITDMVTRILDVKSIDAKQTNLRPIKFTAAEEIVDMLVQHTERARKKDISIKHTMDDFETILDQGLFRQVTENLVTNAIKFSPKSTTIQVTLSLDGDHFLFSVKDQGPGLTEDDKSKLFGKFTQLSAKPTGGETSTGLGLSIVKKFAEKMQGNVWCESEPGQGANFIIKFPQFMKIKQ
jgi:two-component system sensor histidine kinase/response regulator